MKLIVVALLIASVCSFLLGSCQADEVRICGLPPDATNITCDLQKYSTSVSYRVLPVLIVSFLLLVGVSIAICLPCCAQLDCCSIGSEPSSDEYRYGNVKQSIWFMIAFLILLVGCGCGIYASVKSNDIFQVTTSTLIIKSNDLQELGNTITEELDNTTLAVSNETLDKLQTGLNDIHHGIQSFITEMKKTSPYKDIYTYVSTTWIVLLGAVSLLYVATGNRFLFHLIGFLAWWTLLGVCIYLVAMSFITVIFYDSCNEFNYKPNILDLLQIQLDSTYSDLYTQVQSQQDAAIDSLCTDVTKYCDQQPTLCQCNTTTFPSLPSRILIIDGVVLNVSQCATSCTGDIKTLCKEVLDAVTLNDVVDSVLLTVEELVVGFLGSDVAQVLKLVVCNSTAVTNPLWASGSLVIFGLFFQTVVLLALDRALCCFKYERYNSDDYQELRQI